MNDTTKWRGIYLFDLFKWRRYIWKLLIFEDKIDHDLELDDKI